jgi:hypothetical protein
MVRSSLRLVVAVCLRCGYSTPRGAAVHRGRYAFRGACCAMGSLRAIYVESRSCRAPYADREGQARRCSTARRVAAARLSTPSLS